MRNNYIRIYRGSQENECGVCDARQYYVPAPEGSKKPPTCVPCAAGHFTAAGNVATECEASAPPSLSLSFSGSLPLPSLT